MPQSRWKTTRKARLTEKSNNDKAALAKERFEFQKKKARPAEPNWKEHLKGMRQQAMDMGFIPPDPPQPHEALTKFLKNRPCLRPNHAQNPTKTPFSLLPSTQIPAKRGLQAQPIK